MSLGLTEKEYRMKERGVLSDKELLSQKVIKIAKECKNLNELEQKLQKQNIEIYKRKEKLTGIWLGKRKFRLTTLGVGKEHLKILSKEQERLDQLEKLKAKSESRHKARNR